MPQKIKKYRGPDGSPEGRHPAQRRQKSPEQALSALMRYCARAERSSGDALRLMRGWGIGEADAGKLLAKLCEHKFIDDRRFAEAYVRDKSRFAGWGVYKIRTGLRSKGIAPEIVAEVTANQDSGQSESKLHELLTRKASGLKGTPYEKKGKLVRFGLSRGFEYDMVIRVCETVIEADPE